MRFSWFLLLIPVLLCWGTGSAAPSISWKAGPELPSARDYLGCGVVNGVFVVAGGAYWANGAKHYSKQTIAYSSNTRKWYRLPELPRPGAYGATAVYRGCDGTEELLIAGGADHEGAISACYRLFKGRDRWQWKRLPDLPYPLAGAAGAVVGSRFYVFGGAPSMDEAGFRNARPGLLVLDLRGGTRWTSHSSIETAGAPCGGRAGCAFVAAGGKLYAFGGYGVLADGTLGNFRDAYVLDLLGTTMPRWKRIADPPVASRWTSGVRLDDRYIGLFGGFGEAPERGFLNLALAYDVMEDRYLDLASLPKPAAVMAYGSDAKGTVFLAGGEDKERQRSSRFAIGRFSVR